MRRRVGNQDNRLILWNFRFTPLREESDSFRERGKIIGILRRIGKRLRIFFRIIRALDAVPERDHEIRPRPSFAEVVLG